MLTVGVDGAAVEGRLRSGGLACPDCGGRLAPWGRARRRTLRGESGGLVLTPRRAICSGRGCGTTHVLLPASVLLRRADVVTVIGAALLAKVAGQGHRRIAERLGRPAGTVRGWLRRIGVVAGRVHAVLAAVAAELGAEFIAPVPAGSVLGDLVGWVGALAAAVVRRLGPCVPWRLAAVATNGLLLAPAGPRLPRWWINTGCPWAAAV